MADCARQIKAFTPTLPIITWKNWKATSSGNIVLLANAPWNFHSSSNCITWQTHQLRTESLWTQLDRHKNIDLLWSSTLLHSCTGLIGSNRYLQEKRDFVSDNHSLDPKLNTCSGCEFHGICIWSEQSDHKKQGEWSPYVQNSLWEKTSSPVRLIKK